jgi:hypothetical protein
METTENGKKTSMFEKKKETRQLKTPTNLL